ncbi:SDR family oxidoreductase [Shewanella gelidimarina]|uniref:SDR family oxidoreductase n=1 Tax=Shewanella gelidimarina TaxID=56813 RepID=UPI00200E6DE0|nr:SDR family oxidoreductase [Shewanella gelidimarina]MCL1059250.1 SDR family oxidoreductase [Shewanella gelidimarina]
MNILITGTSSGFGREMAIALAQSGHRVYAAMRCLKGKNNTSAAAFMDLSETLEGQIIPLEMDVTSDASVENALVTVANDLSGTLDVVINNAGCYIGGLNETFTSSQVQQMFDTNLLGPLRVMRAVLPTIRQQGKGTIINVTSSLSNFVLPLSGLYTASKTALETVTESYAYELAPLGIETLIVQPGAFNTGIMEKSHAPDESERASGYGATLNQTENMIQQFMALVQDSFFNNSPKMVADSVVALLERPYGSRPFRTLVDPSVLGGQVAMLNDQLEHAQQTFLKSVNIEHMANIQEAQ